VLPANEGHVPCNAKLARWPVGVVVPWGIAGGLPEVRVYCIVGGDSESGYELVASDNVFLQNRLRCGNAMSDRATQGNKLVQLLARAGRSHSKPAPARGHLLETEQRLKHPVNLVRSRRVQ